MSIEVSKALTTAKANEPGDSPTSGVAHPGGGTGVRDRFLRGGVVGATEPRAPSPSGVADHERRLGGILCDHSIADGSTGGGAQVDNSTNM